MKSECSQLRRVAAHEVVCGNSVVSQCVVEIVGGVVTGYFHFDGELPYTEWIGGTIMIERDSQGLLRAYHDHQLL